MPINRRTVDLSSYRPCRRISGNARKRTNRNQDPCWFCPEDCVVCASGAARTTSSRGLSVFALSTHYRLDGVQRQVDFGPGELLVMPRGIEHKPSALPGTELMLVERAELPNTGNVRDSGRTAAPQVI